MRARFAFLLSFLVTACFTVDFDVDVELNPDDPLELELGHITAECDDPLTHLELEHGWVDYSTTRVGDLCHIHVVGEITFLDMAEVKKLVDEKIVENGEDPAEIGVDIEAVTIRFEQATLRDARGNDITPPRIPEWSAMLDLNGEPFVELGGKDVTSLLEASRSVALSKEQVAAIDAALASGAPIVVHAELDLALALSDITPAYQGAKVGLFTSTLIHAIGTKDLF